jgi:hypothetical protein
MCRTHCGGRARPTIVSPDILKGHRVTGRLLLSLLFLAAAASPADAKTRVAEFKGTGNTTTAIFRVESPWILDWRLDGDFEQMMGLEVTLIDARNSRHLGRVVKTKIRSNGVRLFYEGGLYQLRVNSTLARWTVRIEQLTREEAELYQPKGQN